jgi:GH25 family lysozyme M1 (1,4-beta-N-acetylmuramidase)
MSPVATIWHALINCASTDTWAVGMCGQFCAAMYGYGFSGYNDAVAQWQATPLGLRHTGAGDPPAGALVFWSGGSAGHGHVAIADGTGYIWSIDISGPGTVSRVLTGTISSRWGLKYLGWTAPYFQGEQWSPVMIYGVDVSNYQAAHFPLTTPNDNKRVDYAFIKITEGMTYVNPLWVQQRQWSRDNGLVTGFYHFARPGSMVDQAEHFLSQIALAPGDVIAFDWEDSGVTGAQKDAWITYMQKRVPGHKVILYCNRDFWLNRDTTSFAGDGLWIADPNHPAGAPAVQSSWLLHQYSEAGGLDHDVAQFASRAEMITWAEGVADMPLSTDDKNWISGEIQKQLKALVYGLVWDQDKTPAPDTAPDKATNPTWVTRNFLRGAIDNGNEAADQLAKIVAQAEANGSSLTEIKTALANLDLDALVAKIKALKIVLDVQEGA